MAPTLHTAGLVTLALIALLGFRKYLQWRQVVRSIQNHPGYRTLFGLNGIASNLMAPTRGITLGYNNYFLRKHADFAEHGWDIISSVSILPSAKVMFLVADPVAIKEITSDRIRFPKPVHWYALVSQYGPNIIASEGPEWRRYRKICAPAFSERNNQLVWDETMLIMTDLFDNVWGTQKTIVSEHALEITLPIALFVIGAAGFGRRISWNDNLVVPPGHEMTFKEALHVVATNVLFKILLPQWAFKHGVTKRIRKVRLALDELERYMLEMIHDRRDVEKKLEQHDLFHNLLKASEDQPGGEPSMSDGELVGNIFIFLLAGHETTAHTLCFTFALLALYPDEQEKLYRHIKNVIPDGTVPTYDQMNLFTYSTAVFYETLRMYPPGVGIPKYASEDTVLSTTSTTPSSSPADSTTVPIPAGTELIIHIPGLHYNPRYWKDPHTFDPSRFLADDWPREAFLPFSAGARACLGRKFFETEGIAILTMLVSRYAIELKDEPEFAGETFEQKKARLLRTRSAVTLGPVKTPLVFKRRD